MSSTNIGHEQLVNFNNLADQRYANIIATGKAIPWEAMRAYLESRIAGIPAERPEAVLINPPIPMHDDLKRNFGDGGTSVPS